MYYEINVSKVTGVKHPPYQHLFATAKRSLTSEAQAEKVFMELKARFPEPDYKITVTRYEESGTEIIFGKEEL